MSNLYLSEKHADLYVQNRPRYPQQLRDVIIKYLQDGGGGTHLALDVGCGNGQGTIELIQHFENVIGCDVSDAQIKAAPKHEKVCADFDHCMNHELSLKFRHQVSFRVSPAENLSFCDDNSVDLITVATALHWFDLDKFFAEVKRVLKRNGVLAAYCYRLPALDNEEASTLVAKVLNSSLFVTQTLF